MPDDETRQGEDTDTTGDENQFLINVFRQDKFAGQLSGNNIIAGLHREKRPFEAAAFRIEFYSRPYIQFSGGGGNRKIASVSTRIRFIVAHRPFQILAGPEI